MYIRIFVGSVVVFSSDAKRRGSCRLRQAVVFRDIDYSELVRVEMRGIRKLGDNPVLASVEFEVRQMRRVRQ